MKEKDFDISVRKLMEDARAEVSPGVWKAVASGIAPKRVPFYLYSIYATAAAAAVVGGVFLLRGPRTEVRTFEEPVSGEIVAAVVEETPVQEIVPTLEEIPVPEDIPVLEEAVASSAILSKASYAEASVPEEAPTPAEAPKTAVPVKSGKHTEDALERDRIELAKLSLAEKKEQDNKGKGLSFSVGADLQNNRRTSIRNGYFAPRAPQAPNGEGIYNAYPEVGFSLPFTVGLGVKYNLSKRFAVGTGLRYTVFTRTFVADYYDADGFPWKETDIDNTQHYIGVPINLYYSLISTKYWQANVFAGGTVEYLADNHFLIHATPEDRHYHKNDYPLQFSAGIGLGVEFRMSERTGIYFDPSIRYYFATDRQPRSIRTLQPLRFDFEAGVRFYL